MNYRQAKTKLAIEYLLMLPFVWAGKLWAMFSGCYQGYSHYFFFPNADIGGTPQVNADITACLADQKPLVIFSKKPRNNQFWDRYQLSGVTVLDLHRKIDNKKLHFVNFFYRGVLAYQINKSKNPVVFGGESLFFYKIIPHIRKNIKCVELSNVGTWLPYNIGFAKRLNTRICSSQALRREVAEQYKKNEFDSSLFDKLLFIDNAIDIPAFYDIKNEKLEVVFIGRGSPQKRVYLTAAIANQLFQEKASVHFSFVGDVETVINPTDYPFCTFYGSVKDPLVMEKIYQQSDVLILTSAFEGLPLVVMQMMVHGKVIVSTAVNAIPDYITHLENGMLISQTDEQSIVSEGAGFLKILNNDRLLLKALGANGREKAIQLFSRKAFCTKYRSVLSNEAIY